MILWLVAHDRDGRLSDFRTPSSVCEAYSYVVSRGKCIALLPFLPLTNEVPFASCQTSTMLYQSGILRLCFMHASDQSFSLNLCGAVLIDSTVDLSLLPQPEIVALGEEELNAIGQRRRSEAMLDMRKHKRKGKGKTKAEAKIGTTPTAATPPLPQKKSSSLELRPPAKDNRGGAVLATPPSVSTAVPKPRRSTASLGNVGEHKVKVSSFF